MTEPRRAVSLLFFACSALALHGTGCGVQGADDAGPTTTTTSRQSTATIDRGAGTTAVGVPTTDPAPTPSTEAAPSTTLPEPSTPLPPGLGSPTREQLEDLFKTSGFTDEQAKCLTDAYLDQIEELDPTDTDKLLDIFAACNLDPEDLGGPGGG